jgi:S-DNA-T family DNA segregation ATPase FtsK/SpoIIIE
MAKKSSRKSSSRRTRVATDSNPVTVAITRDHIRRIFGILIAVLGVLLGLGMFDQAGPLGNALEGLTRFLFGIGAYVMPLVLAAGGVWMIASTENPAPWRRFTDVLLLISISLSVLFTFLKIEIGGVENTQTTLLKIIIVAMSVAIIFIWQYTSVAAEIEFRKIIGSFLAIPVISGFLELAVNGSGGGGVLGQLVGGGLQNILATAGAIVVLVVFFFISIAFLFPGVMTMIHEWIERLREARETQTDEGDRNIRVLGIEDEETVAIEVPAVAVAEVAIPSEPKVTGLHDEKKSAPAKSADDLDIDTSSPIVSDYTIPSLKLLSKNQGKASVGDIKEYAQIIESTLGNFGINVSIDEISVGPAVTRYAMAPAKGTKLSKIKGLQNELSLALAAHPLRIEAPIPGKSLVGVELPNKVKSMVGLGSMLDEPEFRNTKKPLLVSLGKGVSGKPYFADIAAMPHMLVAGATGSGKSVTAHNIIISLLYQHGPETLRFMMVDPKRVELTLYDKIPHLLTPVIKTAKKAILALAWATKEMDRRYDILEQHKVRDIGSYHTTIVKPAYAAADAEDSKLPERMPYIVIIIDEMADLMQAYPRELEAQIVRLAQMSRAVGIHLVLSTQRPSVNVITGLIKANVPTRLALKVSSSIDSRTILDSSGAETLLGKGDMLYRGGEMSKPERIQCAYVSEDEVKAVVAEVIKKNREYLPDEVDIPENIDSDRSIASGSFASNDGGDDLVAEAREIVIDAGKASTSYLQRKLRIGYSRAASIIDELEEAGVVGPAKGSKPRDILVESANSRPSAPPSLADTDEYEEDDDDQRVPDELEDDVY